MLIDDLKQKASEIKDISAYISKTNKKKKSELFTLDQLRNDILHEIELNGFPAHVMMKKYKELETVLQLRRAVKNDIEYIAIMKSALDMQKLGTIENDLMMHTRMKKSYSVRVPEARRKQILGKI